MTMDDHGLNMLQLTQLKYAKYAELTQNQGSWMVALSLALDDL